MPSGPAQKHRTGEQSVDVWGNTQPDGSGKPVMLTLLATGELVVTASTTSPLPVIPGLTAVTDGRQVVTTAGTRVQLTAGAAKIVIITAETDNTGIVVVGGSTVVAALATRRGTPLYPGDSLTILVDDLSDIYIDSTVNGEGVTYVIMN